MEREAGGAPACCTYGAGAGGAPACCTDGAGAGGAPACCTDGARAGGAPACCTDGAGAGGAPACCTDGAGAGGAPACCTDVEREQEEHLRVVQMEREQEEHLRLVQMEREQEEHLRVVQMEREQEEHLRLVQMERCLYKTIVKAAKDTAANLGLQQLSANNPCSRSMVMHYSFDYAQQVHLPSSPMQPGPLYFLVPRKWGLFGVCCEAISKQINFLIDEAHLVSKGSNAVISFLLLHKVWPG